MVARHDAINHVIGDMGFLSEYHRQPDDRDSDTARIRAHLRYVVRRLRRADSTGWDHDAREGRTRCIALLEDYIAAGQFPHNTYTARRCPVFIDARGRLCAVGFLIAMTEGLGAARVIADIHRLSYIEEIDHPSIDAWASKYGFERHELAMIQPQYGESPAALTTLHYVIAMGVTPLLTLSVAFLTIKKTATASRQVLGAIVTVWGGAALFAAVPMVSQMSSKLAVAHILSGVFFVIVGALGMLSVRLEKAGQAAFSALTAAMLAISITFVVSVLPLSSAPCPQTNFGQWLCVVSPYMHKAFRSPNPYAQEPPGRGVGAIKACSGNLF